ncbi:MAG TPA: hypothetical protein VI548_00300 [Chitinophagaceae bacterium]|nr:hypothetical protein [Chitinophagaceae bacterium]
MKNKIPSFLAVILFFSSVLTAQVPVREEPRHKPVLENNYLRLLDVWLPPGDTTLFHIHSTPSFFIYLNKAKISSQVKGQGWINDESVTGFAWYNPFFPDTLIHRVCNEDTVSFHVNDIEILSPFTKNNAGNLKALDFPVLLDNEKAFAYQLHNSNIKKQSISGRGPMVAVLVVGEKVIFQNTKTNQIKEIKTGEYLYIEPGTSFYFSTKDGREINMVLFEIK